MKPRPAVMFREKDEERNTESDAPPSPARAPLARTASHLTRLTRMPAASSASGCSPANPSHNPEGVCFIQSAQITWRTDNPRTLSAEVLIKAKKGFFPTATLRVKGQLKIDDSLTATLSNLSVEGEGIVGGIGAGLIRPKLMKAEGMTRSLLAWPLDALRITDMKLVASAEALSVEATFEG